MLDEKDCYLFGRNSSMTDVCIDHSSCSRVHAALVYHKHLNRFFLTDLGSTHGTFVGNLRLEPHKPTQLPLDSTFRFGASSRRYTLREKPSGSQAARDGQEVGECDVPLPDSELELDNLTEYNTASNKRVCMIALSEPQARGKKRKERTVCFREEEEVINPEDIDPSVGKFRNLIQTSVVPHKRPRDASVAGSSGSTGGMGVLRPEHSSSPDRSSAPLLLSGAASVALRLQLPNPAPDVDQQPREEEATTVEGPSLSPDSKKRYAKESWPGRAPSVF